MAMGAKCLFLIITICCFGVDCQVHNYYSYSQEGADQKIPENNLTMKWIHIETAIKKAAQNFAKILLPAAFEMAATSNITVNCTRSLAKFATGVTNMKTWAIKMFDSWDKISYGLMSGKAGFIGNYDQCIETDVPSHGFQGKFCFVEPGLILPERPVFASVEDPIPLFEGLFEPETAIKYLADLGGWLYFTSHRFGLCVPSTCSKNDVKILASSVYSSSKVETKLSVLSCDTKEDLLKPYTAGEISIIILFSSLISLVVIGTIVDIYQRFNSNEKIQIENESTTLKFILCFSAYTNFLSLIKKDTNPDTIKMFHGLRVISMCWVILGHSYFPVNYQAFEKAYHYKDMGKGYLIQLVGNGFLAVDNFIFMSSVLIAYVCLRLRGKISIFMIFLKRYYRLTPTLMLIVAFFRISERFGSGPLWQETVGDVLSKNCKERGWLNLLYINNIIYSSKVCLGWTWYLSADTQMFLISLFILTVFKRKVSEGFLVIGVTMILSTMVSAFCHIYYELPPTYLQSYVDFKYWYIFGARGYVQIQYHLPVCCTGLITGYILVTKKGRIPKTLNVFGWILSFAIFISINLLTHHWNQGLIPSSLVSALYGSMHRTIYGFTLAFVTLSCCWGGGGFVNSFLSWDGFVPLSRLTYMVYLLHYGLNYFFYGYLRQPIDYNHRTLSCIYLNNVAASFILAFILGFIFETPFMALDKLISGGQMKRQIVSVSSMHESNVKAKHVA